MTWSIVARDRDGSLGVAVASKFFAVGALCPFVQSGVGALATQALVNPLYGRRGLDLLAQGIAPAETLKSLVGPDAGRDQRQVHLVDAQGRVAAHTGTACIAWAGHSSGEQFSVAGNMLAGPRVIEDTAAAYARGHALPFAERLMAALTAGEAAGGDKRGKQAAALLVCTTEDYPVLNLRVDDHEEPLLELRRLYDKSLERFQPFLACMASRSRPAGLLDRAAIETEIQRFQAVRGR
ncbi:MAG TPA: DUF1028 domain-containing protein [Alphaproteobacteria bacterium]|nr:DUF1028 domain-containing protein [Alphaproteobacteria bacterium]